MRSWTFARRPFWLFSHIFAVSVVVLFVFLGLWQLDRLGQRRTQNDIILSRTDFAPASISDLLDEPEETLEFRRVVDRGRFVDDEVVRIGSQTQDGSAGDHLVGVVELEDGTRVAVNRGYVPLAVGDEFDSASEEEIEIVGWLRLSQSKEGIFGAPDGQSADRLPRFNVPTVDDRVDGELAPIWIQLNPKAADEQAAATDTFPAPVPLPPLGEGSHLSYAVQWFTFALLGVAVYIALLRRIAHTSAVAAQSAPTGPDVG